jgi:flagellar M-ring protein FliF
VRSAIGFDQKRGDQVEVVNLRFAEVPGNAIAEPSGLMSFMQFTKDDVMHWAEELVMAILAFVVLLMVVRPLVNRIITPDQPAVAALAGADPSAALVANAEQIAAVPSPTAKMIDIAQVQGQVHAQSVQKVGDLADKNPNEAVSIIRSWLHESA